jgi:hypothetical protein
MIDFLKKYSLPLGLRLSLRRRPEQKPSKSYREAKTILLFFISEGNQKIALIKGMQNRMEREGKKVRCLYLLMKDEDRPDVHLDEGMARLEQIDFSLFGNILKPEVKQLLDDDFDFMIHFDMDRNIYSDLVMSKSNAKCRIGRYFDNHENQYDMMVKVSDDKKINFLLDQIYHYTKAL